MTLRVLVEQPGKLVDKEELIRNIWPDTFVQDVTVAPNIADLLRALGEPPLRLTLKSGNFGSPDFFRKALHALE